MNTLSITLLSEELRRLEAMGQLPARWQQAWQAERWHELSVDLLKASDVGPLLQQADPLALIAVADYLHHALAFRLNLDRLTELQEVLEARLQSLVERPEYATLARERLAYYRFMRQVLLRSLKKRSIEQFELQIEEIDWPPIAHPLRSRYAFWVGFVYLHEQQPEWRAKCRPWLEKAVQESRSVEQLVYQAYLLYYYLTSQSATEPEPLRRSLEVLRLNLQHQDERPTLQLLWAEIELLWLRFLAQSQPTTELLLEATQQLTNQAAHYLQTCRNDDPMLYLILCHYKIEGLLEQARVEQPEMGELLYERALSLIESAIHRAETIDEREIMTRFYLQKGDIFLSRKQLREAQRMYREALTEARQLDLPALWPRAFVSAVEAAFRLGQIVRAVDQLNEGFAFGRTHLGEGGFALVLHLLRYTNDLLLEEIKRPGVSWVSDHLEPVFGQLEALHEALAQHVEVIGREKFAFYQREFLRFEPLSKRHIRVYLRYQYQQIKLLQLSALFSRDEQAQQLASQLLQHLNQPTNPLMLLIQARWQDFREVPNEVRNQVLNRCITIAKGDLPKASEHLDFSYRNLRSYITVGGVKRLGFFLDELDTPSRPLELGTRLLLNDLFEAGTSLDILFDLPAFIVRHASTGFTVGDMENELNVKYSTAKKYIKLLIDFSLIKVDRSPHRKGFYVVLRDRILSRYLSYKEQLEAQSAAPPPLLQPEVVEQD